MKLIPSLLLALGLTATAAAQEYQWESVPIVGGGFVPGIIFHPTAPGVRYCRTDMGGAYRWNDTDRRWEQLLDWVSLNEANLQGVESIAIDPNDPLHVMMACGTYTRTNGSMLTSHDGGKTWLRTDVPFGMGGNENGRGNGERLMIDPQNPSIAYMGTRGDGLWRTLDDGRTWDRVLSFPDVREKIDIHDNTNWDRGSGVIAVVFDQGKIFAAVSLMGRDNLYVSSDKGETWQPVAQHPSALRPTHMVLSTDHKLYLSYADSAGPSNMKDGAVWCYDIDQNLWKDITPLRPEPADGFTFGYAAVSVDQQNPKHLIASTHCLWGKRGNHEDEIFRSTDGGKKWTPVFKHGFEYDYSVAPYIKMAPLHWMFDIEIDPLNPDHAMFTTGFGGWETWNLSACEKKGGKVIWSLFSNGIEETVPLELFAPTQGARLLSGVGDYGGFTHDDITRPVPQGSNYYPYFSNTDGITAAWHDQLLCVRVGEVFHGKPGQLPVSWSADGGHEWQMCKSVPVEKAHHGHIAVSADGKTWIWTPERELPYYTTDRGESWTAVQGLPKNIKVIADKENSNRFYAVDVVLQKLYVSEDQGHNFVTRDLQLNGYVPIFWDAAGFPSRSGRGDNRGGQDRVYATPGHEGDLWIAAYDGLYRLQLPANATQSADRLLPTPFSQVKTLYAFGFGKGLTDAYPSLYIIGVVNGQYGFFRSDDQARSWTRINDDAHQYGLVLHIIGDMQEYGRVYVGTHGRGIVTGAPSK